jgi:uncharacterized membrane protein YqaE (UPF0057 family)
LGQAHVSPCSPILTGQNRRIGATLMNVNDHARRSKEHIRGNGFNCGFSLGCRQGNGDGDGAGCDCAFFLSAAAEIRVMASPTGKGSMKLISELMPCGVYWTASSRLNISFIINILLTHLNFINSILQKRVLRRASPQFFFSPITSQSNDRLFLAETAGEKWRLGFRTAMLGRDLF